MKHALYFMLIFPLGIGGCDLAGFEMVQFESNYSERLVYAIDQTGEYTDGASFTKEQFRVGLDIPADAENIEVKLQSVTMSWATHPENEVERVRVSALVTTAAIFKPFVDDYNLFRREELILQGPGAAGNQLLLDLLLNQGVGLINEISQGFVDNSSEKNKIAVLLSMTPENKTARMRTDLILSLKYNVSYELCIPVLLGDNDQRCDL